ncbi:NAD(P)/FAD-dependent oxidoreductase [Actinocatenispora sera]|uniref:NAD(P)/FAD-dependent oxidoreductase n=1 Tax=Actinocatenispora sera TaxID=390989 RepID=UPI0033C659B8
MSREIGTHYDVVIMGGGPGGSTLATQLARTTDLSVAIFDKVKFPREHIGESLAHPSTSAMQQIGVLDKVMNADFTVKKYGGIFYWDGTEPTAGFFDHAHWAEDGQSRFAFHVNREDLDNLLLRHAEEQGVHVFEETSVQGYTRLPGGCEVRLAGGRTVHGTFFVDASGRRNSITSPQRRQHLSAYRNIAVWQHYTGCRHGYSIDRDWNIFHDGSKSPIVCSAFEDGWGWFIPVPKKIDGRWVVTHSIGIVTVPEVLREDGKDFTDPDVFRKTIDRIPLIRDLATDGTPIRRKMSTATNYSMINDEFVNFDDKWLLVGDAAYFVDPLFSSGVAFAMHHALSAATLIRTAVDPNIPEQYKRDVWTDYDREWHAIAETYSLSIDQWYHAIGENHPQSVYWKSRGNTVDLGVREETFEILLSTAMDAELLRTMTKHSYAAEDLDPDGPYVRALGLADPGEPGDDDVVRIAEGATMRESLGLDLPGFKGNLPPVSFGVPAEYRDAVARYWSDPIAHGDALPSPMASPEVCHRFSVPGADREVRSFPDQDGGVVVWKALSSGPRTYRELRGELNEIQLNFIKLLMRAGVVEVATAGTAHAGPVPVPSAD